MEKKITVSRKKAKKLTVSRKKAKILAVNGKSPYPIETLNTGNTNMAYCLCPLCLEQHLLMESSKPRKFP